MPSVEFGGSAAGLPHAVCVRRGACGPSPAAAGGLLTLHARELSVLAKLSSSLGALRDRAFGVMSGLCAEPESSDFLLRGFGGVGACVCVSLGGHEAESLVVGVLCLGPQPVCVRPHLGRGVRRRDVWLRVTPPPSWALGSCHFPRGHLCLFVTDQPNAPAWVCLWAVNVCLAAAGAVSGRSPNRAGRGRDCLSIWFSVYFAT